LPTSFLPNEDEGFFMAQVKLPEGASLERTRVSLDKANKILLETEGVGHFITIGGFSIFDGTNSSSSGTLIAIMDPWDKRKKEHMHVENVVQKVSSQLMMIGDGFGMAIAPPPIMGLGFAGGIEMQIQDRAGLGFETLHNSGRGLMFAGMSDPVLARAISVFNAEVPQLFLDIDRTKAKTLDVPLTNIYHTLQTCLGGMYINDFNMFGRTFKVMAQADQEFRNEIDDILQLEVRNNKGDMVPLRTLLMVAETAGPQSVTHFNLYPSSMVMGGPKPGFSSGQAMDQLASICEEQLPAGMKYEWSGISYQEQAAGSQGGIIFLMAAVFVFLFLAAQYESWSIPIAILMSVPIAIFGAVMFTMARGYDNNTYTQIGLVLLIGLASKTSILLVEFAKQYHEDGHTIMEAATAAARLRFRPILMTALSFVLGVVPLVVATGAGAVARKALGTAVFGGMLMATVVGIFMMPVFYLVVQKVTDKVLKNN
jgi:HAE1 family hydrophobic/amphiphilic exporter-1